MTDILVEHLFLNLSVDLFLGYRLQQSFLVTVAAAASHTSGSALGS